MGRLAAPYFGPELAKFGSSLALELWEGYRDMEEYAREVFPVEEAANGLTWMDEEDGERGEKEVESDVQGRTSSGGV